MRFPELSARVAAALGGVLPLRQALGDDLGRLAGRLAHLRISGDFALHVKSIFLTDAATFTFLGRSVREGREAIQFEFKVPRKKSRYLVRSGPERQQMVGYHGSFQVDVKTGMKPEELAAVVGQYHGLGVRSASKVTAAVLANPGNLKIIGRAGVGVDNIDVDAATERGIVVVNAPAGNTIAVAEHTLGLIIAAARNIPQLELNLGAQVARRVMVGVGDYK